MFGSEGWYIGDRTTNVTQICSYTCLSAPRIFSVTAVFVMVDVVDPVAPLAKGADGGVVVPGGEFNAALDMSEVSAVVYRTNLRPDTVS